METKTIDDVTLSLAIAPTGAVVSIDIKADYKDIRLSMTQGDAIDLGKLLITLGRVKS
jgi:hypothetical protein